MRELKFRLYAERGYFEKFDLLEDGDDTFHDFCWLDSHTDADIEQYTGIKDKNGVEIYEGDIIAVRRNETLSSDYNAIGSEVKFIEDICGFGYITNNGEYGDFGMISSSDIEIIGHIHMEG